jgi:hypothetical protein
MAAVTIGHPPETDDLFDLDIKVDFDTNTITDVLSSIRCGPSECCTSWLNCPYTCDSSCSDVTCGCNGC